MTTTSTEFIPTQELHFDRKNPRLAEFGIDENSGEKEILKILWDEMDVEELVMSIASSGYFKHELLVVVEEDNRNVVIEGNRRLAAVKALIQPDLVPEWQQKIPKLSAEKIEKLRELPVHRSTRKDAWSYLGFKHVNGPAKWTSYAKAQYIASVHRKHGISLAEIAQQIGDKHKTVQRLYRSLMVIEQAEANGLYDREDRDRRHFSFSHLYTGLEYDGFRKFLSLGPTDTEDPKPVPKKAFRHLQEVCIWLYGSKKSDQRPIVQSQNPDLRRLNEALKSTEAIEALRAGESLDYAHELSHPASEIFVQQLLAAKRALQKARSRLDGYDGSEEQLRTAGTIATIADDIYDEMDRKCNPDKKQRLTEE